METGVDIDQGTLIQVLQNKLAQSAIREAQLEAGVQTLMAQQSTLMAELTNLKEMLKQQGGVSEDASADESNG